MMSTGEIKIVERVKCSGAIVVLPATVDILDGEVGYSSVPEIENVMLIGSNSYVG
jgi:hypothetical protein